MSNWTPEICCVHAIDNPARCTHARNFHTGRLSRNLQKGNLHSFHTFSPVSHKFCEFFITFIGWFSGYKHGLLILYASTRNGCIISRSFFYLQLFREPFSSRFVNHELALRGDHHQFIFLHRLQYVHILATHPFQTPREKRSHCIGNSKKNHIV